MAAVETVRPHGDRVANATHDLYRQFGRQIYAYCFHKLRSREEAEDAVQTTFMNAFRALQRGTSTQFEQAWLYKIAQNVCYERQSSSSRRRLHEAPNDFEVLQEVVPASDRDDSLELIGIEDALEGMPENQRRAILLREWQGLSYREIGEELGLSQAAVEMLIFRARRALAGALEQPDEARAKRRRVGRGATVGGLLSTLKTAFGGGAAIKAVAAAAAAVVVVGESAQHTVVHHPAQARMSHGAAQTAVAQRVSRAIAGVAARPVTAAASAPRAPHILRVAHGRASARVEHESPSRHADTARDATDTAPAEIESSPPPAPVAAAATPAPAVAVAAPAPAPSVPTAQVVAAVAPAPAAPAPVPAPAPVAPAPVADPTLPTLAAQPTPPAAGNGNGNGNGNAWGHDKKDTPAVTAPAATDPAPPTNQGNGTGNGSAQDVTVTAPQPPADHGNGHGNGNGNGKP